MAVNAQKIKDRIKIKFPKLNLSKERLDALADKLKVKPQDEATDEQVDEVIVDYFDVLSVEDIAKLEDQNRTFKSKIDSLSKTSKKGKGKDSDEDDEDDDDTPLNDAPEWAKKLVESNNLLKQQISDLKTEKTTETKIEAVKTKFKSHEVIKDLPQSIQDKLLRLVDISENAVDIDEQVNGLGEEYKEFVQKKADDDNYAGPPGAGDYKGKMSEAKVDEIANAIAGTTSEN